MTLPTPFQLPSNAFQLSSNAFQRPVCSNPPYPLALEQANAALEDAAACQHPEGDSFPSRLTS